MISFVVFVSLGDVIKRFAAATPLAFFASMRPIAKDEPVPRKETLSMSKLEAEGTPNEVMMVLGWETDTRRLL